MVDVCLIWGPFCQAHGRHWAELAEFGPDPGFETAFEQRLGNFWKLLDSFGARLVRRG